MYNSEEEGVFAFLTEQLKNQKLSVLVGSATSLAFSHPDTGKKQPGLVSTKGFVKNRIEKNVKFIEETHSFLEACTAIESQMGRMELEHVLLEEYDKPNINPTFAHEYLSNLNFESYITTNYDTMLERAVAKNRSRVTTIIHDRDLGRLSNNNIPIIKYHGCVKQPDSMIATNSDYAKVTKMKPLVFAKLASTLAEKSLLAVGFSLDDPDFENLINEVQTSMGVHSPKIFAVVLKATPTHKNYWVKNRNCIIIEADLTAFLTRLTALVSSSFSETEVFQKKENWLKNDFFISLNKIKTLPSETQVVDAFIEHLEKEITNHSADLDDITKRAQEAIDQVSAEKGNYVALKPVSSQLIENLKNLTDLGKAELVVRKLKNSRTILSQQFENLGTTLICKSSSILVYSQSKRVLHTLLGAPRTIQASCHLYIAECRPKSPQPFQDALSICEQLEDTDYKITIIPDVAIGNLISRGQIDQILLGAHAIYESNGIPYAFVNTCGTHLIVDFAQNNNPKVSTFVIAEKVKRIEKSPDDLKASISYDEEEDLFSKKLPGISKNLSNSQISFMNIGYDLCPILDPTSILTPDE